MNISMNIQKIYFIDTETETSGEYNKVFCISYTETDEIDKQFNLIKENNKRIDGVEFIFVGILFRKVIKQHSR